MTHQHGRRRVFKEEVGRCRRYQRDAHVFEEVVPGELNGEVTGESVRALDEDSPDPVVGDAMPHTSTTRPSACWARIRA
jgi:hypothetical protein